MSVLFYSTKNNDTVTHDGRSAKFSDKNMCLSFFTLMEFDDNESPEATAESEARKQSTFRTREKEWLKRLKAMQGKQLLVICGANHITPFCELLKSSYFNVVVECELWE